MSDSHPRPRFHELRDTLGKDFAWSQGIVAKEFAYGEGQLDLAPTTGYIAQNPAITAMNGRRFFRTQWTTRRRMCGDYRDEQAGFGDLNLVDQHPFGKWKKWRPFHHNLASQTKPHSRGYLWKVVYHFISLYGK